MIIPALNAAATIGETLASLQAQRFRAWEAVVVDDGSTDDTGRVVAAIATADPRIRLVHKAAEGAAVARNHGLDLTTHEWVLFLDADDWILPEHLERLAGVLDSTPHAHAAVCGWSLVRDGRLIETEYCRGDGDLFPTLARRPAFAIHTCLIARERVEAVGGFDPQCRIHQDWVLWQRVARSGTRFAVIREPLAVYRLHSGSLTDDQELLAAEAMRVIELGHGPDGAVPASAPEHANGRPRDELTDAIVTHLAWPAGIQLAKSRDARPLFREVANGVALGAAEHLGAILGRAAATAVDPVELTAPERWPLIERALDALLMRLAELTGDAELPRTVGPEFERLLLERTPEERTLSRVASARVDAAQHLEDRRAPDGIERVLFRVSYDGVALGFVELPVVAGCVRAAVLADEIASAFAWPILGRHFEATIYSRWRLEREPDGWSVWRGPRRLCAALPDDPSERSAALHDRLGWSVFLDEVWRRAGAGALSRLLARRSAAARSALVPVEVSARLPRIARGGRVALLAGGALVGVIDRVRSGAGRALRAELTDAVGFELCRIAVREALIGEPSSDTPLAERLSAIAKRRSERAATVRDGVAPGSSHAIRSAERCGASALTGRYGTQRTVPVSRVTDVPPSTGQVLDRLTLAGEAPVVTFPGAPDGPIVHDPGVAASDAPLRRVPIAPDTHDEHHSPPVHGRHHFERLFAAGADPWDYESPYERRKYEQTLELIGDVRVRRALEAGPAEGHFTIRLASRAEEVVAADIAEIALGRLTERCTAAGVRNVSTVRLDLSTDPLPGEFDLIVCSEVLYYIGSQAALADVAGRLAAALRPGGVLVTAHAHVLSDAPDETGFDWGHPYGARTIAETLAAVPELALEREIRTPLYRVQRFRRIGRGESRPRPAIEHAANDVLPTGPTATGIRWGGSRDLLPPVATVETANLPILMYHRIADAFAPERARYTLSPGRFEAQLAYLHDAGFRSVSPGEWRDAARARRPLPGRRVMLTFDDAYEDFGSTAWPLLKRFGFHAQLFVVTGHVGRANAWDPAGHGEALLDWSALQALAADGVALGSHTVTHPRLTSCAAATLVDELARSRADLIERMGVAADAIAYPWGGEDGIVRRFAAACGYEYGFTCRSNSARATDALLGLPRLEVRGDLSFDGFVRLLEP